MAAGPVRDDAAVVAGFDRWLAERGPDAGLGGSRVEAMRRPSSGWTNETVMLSLSDPAACTVVVRLPPLVPSFPDQEIRHEAAVLQCLEASPVRAPRVIAVELDDSWLGAPFLVMEFVPGHIVGDVPAFDEWLAARTAHEQRAVHHAFAHMLATVHTLDAQVSTPATTMRTGLAEEISYWHRYVDWAADGAPTRRLVDALSWCRATMPPDDDTRPALLWGDARLGNVVFGDDGNIAALLDWEGASFGPPEMDLGWYLALDALTTHFVGRTVPGFFDRGAVVAAYEHALGRPVAQLDWHEVFALVRSIAVNECQARLADRFGVRYPGVAGDANPVLDYVWARIDAR